MTKLVIVILKFWIFFKFKCQSNYPIICVPKSSNQCESQRHPEAHFTDEIIPKI